MIESVQHAPPASRSSLVEPAFSHFFDFPFDLFQIEAIAHIRDGQSVMVAAPTSSGKTVVAEYALWRALQSGSRAIYTTPIKALSNQKRNDLEALFPGQVGLLTGDRSENPDAPIVVMTTEVLRNMLVEAGEYLHWVTCVVFDEVHFLADPDRGTVWEESIIACPAHIQLICLSATIANAGEIATWIGETHRRVPAGCALVRHDVRPVPLEHFYFTEGRLHLIRDEQGVRRASFPREGKGQAPYPAEVIRAIGRMDLLPAIWFAFSRQAVEDAAEACVHATSTTQEERSQIEAEIAWTLDTLPEEDRKLPQLSLLTHLLRRGVGFHHAGLLPPLKELVERLFTRGLLSVVTATDTLALGINMPARTVVISSLSRPIGGMLSPNDFSQLTGRAGRRGIDDYGAVVMVPSKFHSFEPAYREVCGPLRPIESAFRLRYSTLLSAMEGSDERLDRIVRSSLRQFQIKRKALRAEADIDRLRTELAEYGHEDDEQLADYLTLQAQLTEMEKEGKRARRARQKSSRNPQLVKRHEHAKEERTRLERLVRQHPRHGEALAVERHEPDRLALLRELNRRRATVANVERELEQSALETARSVRRVLTRLGYIGKRDGLEPAGGSLNPAGRSLNPAGRSLNPAGRSLKPASRLARKARGMRQIVAASGIVISELYENGVFESLTPAELAEAISWFASDSQRKRDSSYRLRSKLNNTRWAAIDMYRKIAAMEETENIQLAQGPSEWFYGIALDWANGASIEDITARVALGEGDIVGALNKTVDLLDQFEDMLREYRDEHMLATSKAARRLLVRGLVAMVRTRAL